MLTKHATYANLEAKNSFQLYSDGTRWWVVTIFWDAETADKPIPAKYLSR